MRNHTATMVFEKDKKILQICYANNENCCPCTRHFDLSSTLHSLLLFTSALQATEMIKDIQEDFKNQEYMLCSHRCCPVSPTLAY